MNSLLLQTGITLQLNLRLKYLIKRLTFWIQLFTKARDFTTKEYLTSTHILNLHRLFNIRISLSAILRKGLIKGESLGLLRSNSSAKPFYENIYNFKKRLRTEGYPQNLIEKITSEVKFTEQKSALQKNNEV